MKKVLFSLMAVLLVAGFASVAMAGQAYNTTNGEWRGSMMIFPKVEYNRVAAPGAPLTDTLIQIHNDSGSDGIDLHCYFMDEYQAPSDHELFVTKREPFWYVASGTFYEYGTGDTPLNYAKGAVICFAVTPDDFPTNFNWLTGTATIYDFTNGTSFSYNAYGFRRSGADGTTNVLTLNGAEYDRCPDYLLGKYMLKGAQFTNGPLPATADLPLYGTVEASTTELVLMPCIQDLQEARTPTYTKALFTIHDENEMSLSGTELCFKCWVETTLTVPPKASVGFKKAFQFQRFLDPSMPGTFAAFRVTGVAAPATYCGFEAPGVATPLLGVINRYELVNGQLSTSGDILQSTARGSTIATTIKYELGVGNGGGPDLNVR